MTFTASPVSIPGHVTPPTSCAHPADDMGEPRRTAPGTRRAPAEQIRRGPVPPEARVARAQTMMPERQEPASAVTSSSTQSKDRVTAFFQSRSFRAAASRSICGLQRLSSAQLATTSSVLAQKPTARPAA